jgi:hypothetical protein
MGQRVLTSLTLPLGWYASLQPTNTDLDRAAGRVDFRESLRELTALVASRYQPVEQLAQRIAEAKNALANAQ